MELRTDGQEKQVNNVLVEARHAKPYGTQISKYMTDLKSICPRLRLHKNTENCVKAP